MVRRCIVGCRLSSKCSPASPERIRCVCEHGLHTPRMAGCKHTRAHITFTLPTLCPNPGAQPHHTHRRNPHNPNTLAHPCSSTQLMYYNTHTEQARNGVVPGPILPGVRCCVHTTSFACVNGMSCICCYTSATVPSSTASETSTRIARVMPEYLKHRGYGE